MNFKHRRSFPNIGTTALPCLAALFIGLAGLTGTAQAVQTFDQVKQDFRSSEAMLYDRHGEAIHQLRINMHERRLPWISIEDMSPALRHALIISEDKRFYQHSGIDWSAVAAASWGNVWRTKTRGASTLTMQLAGLLDEDLRNKNGSRSMMQKVSQAVVAKQLEQSWQKDQILEAYLNLVSFRGELVGVHALSRVMFGKHPSGLNRTEAAIATALIRAPNAKAAKVAERACAILKEQKLPQECANLNITTELTLERPKFGHHLDRNATAPQLAPHLARRLLKAPGQRMTSTLDARLQRFAKDALTRQLAALANQNVEDGAVLVLDNLSGEVLAWIGSSGELSSAEQVDGVLALRQAGSTLKPFLYELAIERKWLTAASLLDDSRINLPTAAGLYIPQNYDKEFKGLISLRTALGSSLNIPAVRTLVMVTPEHFFQRLQALGFDLRKSGDYYGYSLALGSADVSLMALTNAYRTLANQGRYSAIRTTRNTLVSPGRAVMDARAAFIVSDILADRNARTRTFDLENVLSTRIWTAVKTGTSKDMRDNWCIGYSSRYTVGVWIGNAQGQPMWDVSGITGAAPVWQEIMHYLHHSLEPQPAQSPPPGVIAKSIRYAEDIEAARTEYFVAGTEQKNLIVQAKTEDLRPSIRYPLSGMLVALDPDIPPANQRIRFSAQGISSGVWQLDGKRLTSAGRSLSYDWLPWPGKHHLALLNAKGEIVDQVQFEVRGAIETPAKTKGKN